jgi:hypothetical protein
VVDEADVPGVGAERVAQGGRQAGGDDASGRGSPGAASPSARNGRAATTNASSEPNTAIRWSKWPSAAVGRALVRVLIITQPSS